MMTVLASFVQALYELLSILFVISFPCTRYPLEIEASVILGRCYVSYSDKRFMKASTVMSNLNIASTIGHRRVDYP